MGISRTLGNWARRASGGTAPWYRRSPCSGPDRPFTRSVAHPTRRPARSRRRRAAAPHRRPSTPGPPQLTARPRCAIRAPTPSECRTDSPRRRRHRPPAPAPRGRPRPGRSPWGRDRCRSGRSARQPARQGRCAEVKGAERNSSPCTTAAVTRAGALPPAMIRSARPSRRPETSAGSGSGASVGGSIDRLRRGAASPSCRAARPRRRKGATGPSTRSGDWRQMDSSWPRSAPGRRAAPTVRASSSPLKSVRRRTSSRAQSAPASAAEPRAPRRGRLNGDLVAAAAHHSVAVDPVDGLAYAGVHRESATRPAGAEGQPGVRGVRTHK